MNYIIFDLEFNQDFASLQNFQLKNDRYPFEIIQIGAVKLDKDFNTIGTFNRYVRPTFYSQISPFITGLTNITLSQLTSETTFPQVYEDFLTFINGEPTTFILWGMTDIKEIFKNAQYHHIDTQSLPRHYINIQPYVSVHFHLPKKQLVRLEHAVTLLDIPLKDAFHNALNDAYYTGEIFKKLYTPSIPTVLYDPSYRRSPAITKKQQLNAQALINQFEKMYARELSPEEQNMIILAYRMGKTGQFLD